MIVRRGNSVTGVLRQYWRGTLKGWGAALDLALLPVEVLYLSFVNLRLFLYRKGFLVAYRLKVPVISVGNVTMGGTGKTPFSRWVFEQMMEMGVSPGLVSGIWGKDEHLLHETWNPEGVFVITRVKSKGAKLAVSRGANVVIVDDGFQHLQLMRDVDVVIISAEQDDQSRCLPRGLLREPFDGISRADMVLVSRKTASKSVAERVLRKVADFVPEEKIGQIHLRFSCWTDIEGNSIEAPMGRQLVITSIAEPELFVEIVELTTGEISEGEIYRDHHKFTQSDLDYLRIRSKGYNVVMTEKDAIKFKAFPGLLDNVYVLCLELEWERGEHKMIEILRRIKEPV